MVNRNFDTGMYIIDQNYRILNCNKAVTDMYPEVKKGELCYKALALQKEPCATCPLLNNEVLFFNPLRKEWITANAAEMEYPDHGTCYNIQFRMRKNVGGTKREVIRLEKVDDYLAELTTIDGTECVIGAYYEPGSPIFYANENMVSLMGYSELDEMVEELNGLVVNMIHPDDRKRVREDLQLNGEVDFTFETTFRVITKDGTWIRLFVKGKTIKTSTDKLATLCVCSDMATFLRDHSDMEGKIRELLQRELQTASIMNRIPGGYHQCAAEEGYPFLHISESFEEIVGWTKAEIEDNFDNKFWNLVWPEDLDIFTGLITELEDKEQSSVIYRMKRKDGGYRWVQDSTMYVDLGEKSFYQCTIADISEYIEALEEAKLRAEASNRAKSTFLFNVSHDIRTPLNAIKGFTRMLQENSDDGKMVREVLGKIEKSSETLMKLLSDVLELSRIESGKAEVDYSAVNLVDHSDRLYTMLSNEIETADITFIREGNIEDKFVWCDELKLTQIVMNMLSNAKKFTPAGGTIVYGVEQLTNNREGSADYRIYVRDTGIGMSEEFQQRAFEQFERERTSTDSGVIGSGLGMAIIKRLVDLMGGTCTLSSELGKGTEIAVQFSFRIAKEPETQKAEESGSVISFSGKRVLLVEDNDFNREIARYILENLGILVEEAENGSVAVDMMLKSGAGHFDLVLMDIQMPVMDGYTATQEIRRIKEEAIASVPIIAMTANAFLEDKEKCLNIGMNGHISKPIDADLLMEEIAKIF